WQRRLLGGDVLDGVEGQVRRQGLEVRQALGEGAGDVGGGVPGRQGDALLRGGGGTPQLGGGGPRGGGGAAGGGLGRLGGGRSGGGWWRSSWSGLLRGRWWLRFWNRCLSLPRGRCPAPSERQVLFGQRREAREHGDALLPQALAAGGDVAAGIGFVPSHITE